MDLFKCCFALCLINVLPWQVLGDASIDFKNLEKDINEWQLSRAPEHAVREGVRKYDDQLDLSDDSMFDDWKRSVKDFKVRLGGIQKTQLSSSEQGDYDVLMDFLQTFLDGYQWRNFLALNPVSTEELPLFGGPETFVSGLPFYTRGDFENYISKLNAFTKQVDEMIRVTRKAIAFNRTYNYVSVSTVPSILNSWIVTPEINSLLYKPFLESLDNLTTITESERLEWRIRGDDGVKNFNTATKKLSDFIHNEYNKPENLRTALGVHGWEQGKEYYKASLKWYLSIDMSPEEVHQRGLEEVDRISKLMTQTIAKIGFQGSIKEFFQSNRNNSKYVKSNGTEVLELIQHMAVDVIPPKLPLLFHPTEITSLPLRVLPTPTDGTFAYYEPGSSDGTRPGVYRINVFRPDASPSNTFMALTLHEAIPGHHQQISNTITANIPEYRKKKDYRKGYMVPYLFPVYNAFVEGWGLYSEFLGEEMGLYEDPYDLMGRYSWEILRACRLVVDTGIHYFGWNRTFATDYMYYLTASDRGAVENQIDRYSTTPGQACSYKIGEMKIKELRQMATEKLGDKFDIRDFHREVLRAGDISLSVLERNINNWISQKLQETETNPCSVGGASLTQQCFAKLAILSLLIMYLQRML